jgi:hypothetical protein
VKGCKTCEREGERPHRNGQPNRCPEALAKHAAGSAKWRKAHKESYRAGRRRYDATFAGYMSKRGYKLRKSREATLAKLAELHREEMDLWHSYQAQQTQTR